MLTDMHCRTAKPRERLYGLNDRDGLYLEVKPNGVKAFRYRFKLGGKESMMALGEAAHAFAVLADGAQLSEGELQEFVRGRLGPVKTSKSVHFITKLPLTKVGKVDKKALRARFWADSARAVN